MPRLGVVGTLVWDTIHGPDGDEPLQDWGGIAYSLSAWEAMAPRGWSLVPIVKVGQDLRAQADDLFSTLPGLDSLEFVRSVPEPNNRVSLYYHDRSRRCERLTGGVPGWSAAELAEAALSCDALYVNFISGWELDLEAAALLERRFEGLAWCDVHSLILGVGDDGMREPRPLEHRDAWLRAFDLVQVNEDELEMVCPGKDAPGDRLRELLSFGPAAAFLTRGAAGAEWVARPDGRVPVGAGGTAGLAPVEDVAPAGSTDPTGCGDVWGISCFAGLLAGGTVAEAVSMANRLAAVTAGGRGTRGLARTLAEVA
jgi:hypothetical protein